MISTYNWYWYNWYFDLIYLSQEEGKYDKNEDRDRDYYRRRRPAGQGRVSSDLQSTGVINEKLSGDQLINLSPWTICIVLLVSLMTVAYYYCDDQAPGVWPSCVIIILISVHTRHFSILMSPPMITGGGVTSTLTWGTPGTGAIRCCQEQRRRRARSCNTS